MFSIILKWIFYAIVVMFVAWIIPGISVENFVTALGVALILGVINIFLKPVLQLLALPITILTLGIFALVINALLLMFVGYLVPGFEVASFWSAFFGAILISVFGMGINKLDD